MALPILINEYKYAAVVKKGKKELLSKINETIERMEADGELKLLDQKWVRR